MPVALPLNLNHFKQTTMKKNNTLLFAGVFFLTLALVSGCKKTGDPGPAGANGTNGTNGKNGTALNYRQDGTVIELSGTYYDSGTSFDQQTKLPFFITLDENIVTEEAAVLRTEARTSANPINSYFHIVRRDSTNNSIISLDISSLYGSESPSIDNLNIDIIQEVNDTSYKRVSTGYVNTPARTSSATDYFTRGNLNSYDISDNDIQIENWHYDGNTKKLSFTLTGTLSSYYNSTQSDLNFNLDVVADLKLESYRKGNE